MKTDGVKSDGVKSDGVPGVDRRHRFSDLYHERTNFQFLKHAKVYFIISFVVVIVAGVLVVARGLNFSIEFEGGVSWEVKKDGADPDVDEVRNLLEPLGQGDAKITVISGNGNSKSLRVQAELLESPVADVRDAFAATIGKTPAEIDVVVESDSTSWSASGLTEPSEKDILAAVEAVETIDGSATPVVEVKKKSAKLKIADMPASQVDGVTAALADYAGVPSEDVSVSTVGPTWGDEVTDKAILALLAFFVVLSVYLWWRFEWQMAVASILAVIHDIIFTVGAYALLRFEVSPATVTAFLTILGFSLYDTVVVFDKIKENEAGILNSGRSTYTEMANESLNEVLMRSLSTSLVALLPVVSLLIVGSLILGATALEAFALALFAGLAVGSYSSIFVATPLLAWLKERDPSYRALRDKRARGETRAVARQPSRVAVAVGGGDGGELLRESGAESEVPAYDPTGVPGPPAVGRTGAPKGRQQRRRKRR